MTKRHRYRRNTSDDEIRERIRNLDIGHYYIIARAGTGKTQCLAERVVVALNKQDESGDFLYHPEDILCVTFTNSAGDEMRDRIREYASTNTDDMMSSGRKLERLQIGTLHSFCKRYLNKVNNAGWSILDQAASLQIIADILAAENKEFGKKYRYKATDVLHYAAMLRQKQLSHPKSSRLRYFKRLDKEKKQELERIAVKYNEYKLWNSYSDFDDILIDTYSLLIKDKDVKPISFKWVQVDEAQDLNNLQHAIIERLISDEEATCCYFGDFNQSIYSFMGADNNIIPTKQDFNAPGHRFELLVNFRSPMDMVEVFNHYITSEFGTNDSGSAELHHPQEMPGLSIVECSTSSDECLYITEKVTRIMNQCRKSSFYREKGNRPSVAVLVRTAAEADRISDVLLANHISHLKVSGSESVGRDSIKTVIAHFGLIIDEMSVYDWARVLYQLRCASTISSCRWLAHRLLRLAILPSDIMHLEDRRPTLLSTFLEAAKNTVVLLRITRGEERKYEIEAIIVYDWEHVCRTFDLNVGLSDELVSSLKEFVGNHPLLIDNSQRVISSFIFRSGIDNQVISLQRINDLLQFSQLPGSNVWPHDSGLCGNHENLVNRFSRLKYLASQVILEQQFFMAQSGFSVVARKHSLLYKPVWDHTVKMFNRYAGIEPHSMKHSDSKSSSALLAEEMRYVYKTLLKKNIIHNFNPAIYDRKKADLKLKRGTIGFSSDEFETMWNGIIDFDGEQTQVKTDYFFQYVSRIFSRYDDLAPREIMERTIHEIRNITEADLCNQPFVKERINVMTVHQSKGQSFTDVIITGASDKQYPLHYHKLKCEKDEDKRLFYVAMTRASRNLIVTYPRETDGIEGYMSVTPFINSIRGYFTLNYFPDKSTSDHDNAE